MFAVGKILTLCVCVCMCVRAAFLHVTEDIKHGGVVTVQDFYNSAQKGTTMLL